MNSDIRISISFFRHHKTKRVRRSIGESGVISLLQLFCYVGEHRPQGILQGMSVDDIADAAEWQGEAQEFVQALCNAGFLDRCEEGVYEVHDWEEHNPWATGAEERSEKARKAAKKRWENKEREDETPPLKCSTDAKPCSEHATSTNEQCSTDAKPCPSAPLLSSPFLSSPLRNEEDTPPSPPMGGAGHLDASPLPEARPSGPALQPQEPAPSPRKADQLRQLATMVIAAYHEQLPELPQVRSVAPVCKAIAARIRDQDLTADERTQRQGLDWWRNLFASIRGMPWLMGQATSRDGRVFTCSLPWILGPQNLAKILNGAYLPRDGPKSTGSSLTDRNMATLADWIAEKEGAMQ